MSVEASILIVNADPAVAGMFGKHLGAAGFDVHTVPAAADALEWLGGRRVAAVIVDLLLAAPDLFGLLRRLYSDAGGSALPLVVFTAPASLAGKAPAGPDDYAALAEQIRRAGAAAH